MRAALGLGGNLGDREAHLTAAIEALRGVGRVEAISTFHETEPVGGPPQGPYLNAAIVVETDLDPDALLDVAQRIENERGRVRAERWGPRTLDIDLLLCGDEVIDRPGLRVPHPRLAERLFVLAPLREIAADWVVPGLGRTVEALHEDLHNRP